MIAFGIKDDEVERSMVYIMCVHSSPKRTKSHEYWKIKIYYSFKISKIPTYILLTNKSFILRSNYDFIILLYRFRE